MTPVCASTPNLTRPSGISFLVSLVGTPVLVITWMAVQVLEMAEREKDLLSLSSAVLIPLSVGRVSIISVITAIYLNTTSLITTKNDLIW